MSADPSVAVREIESPSSMFKNIPKHKNAPYVAGLEPENYQLAPLNHPSCCGNGENGNDDDIDPMLRNLDPNAKYYYASTRVLGLLVLATAAALFCLWSYSYNQPPRHVPTDQLGAQSSFQFANLGSNSNNGNNKKNKKSSSSSESSSPKGNDKGFLHQSAPPAIGYWHNVELGLDKIRSTETLKAFAVIDKDNVFEWLSHPMAADALYQCFACFVMTVVALAIAKAIPAFSIFICVGFAFLSWVATLADVVIVGSTLMCLDTTSAAPIVKARGCSFPMILHAFCVNAKWACLTVAACLIIVSVRLRGGFFTGPFKRYVNITVCSGLPVCAFALYFYLWYDGLGVVQEAIGSEHGWMLTHREELISMSFNAYILCQIFVFVLLGFALLLQKQLVVLEQDNSGEKKSNATTEEQNGGEAPKELEEKNSSADNADNDEKGKRSWKKASELRKEMDTAAMAHTTTTTKSEQVTSDPVSDKKND